MTSSPGLRERAVAAGLRREIDDDGARLHRRDHRLGDEHRRALAGNRRGRDDEVHVLDVVGERLLDARLLVGGLLARVAARAFGRDADLDEARAERLHLLLHRRPHVERRHDGARAGAPWRSPEGRPRRRR